MTNDIKSLKWLKERLTDLEATLQEGQLATVANYRPEGRKPIKLMISHRLRKQCKKGKVWKSKAMLTAMKNASYGFDLTHARSPGGHDGIFLLTRDYKPKNEMMRRLFDQFIDKPGSGFEDIAPAFTVQPDSYLPVRLVSHHLRLLGVLYQWPEIDYLVLVDYDDTKT